MEHFHHQLRMPASQPRHRLEDAIQAALHPASERNGWDYATSPATLVATADGRPIRSIITGRKKIVTGVYASRKAGRSLPYESMNERAFFMHCEVDPGVLDYRAQPFRLEFLLNGAKRVYIPDCLRLMSDGAVEVVEIKNDRRALRDPDYALKVGTATNIFEAVGWRFRVIYRRELFEPASRWLAIYDVQSWRSASFTQSEVFQVVAAFRNRATVELGALARRLGGIGEGIAKLKAMAVSRIVALDLSGPIGLNTRVSLVAELGEAS